jgi:hypothetical protein
LDGHQIAALGFGQEHVHRRVVILADRYRPGRRGDRQTFQRLDQRLAKR